MRYRFAPTGCHIAQAGLRPRTHLISKFVDLRCRLIASSVNVGDRLVLGAEAVDHRTHRRSEFRGGELQQAADNPGAERSTPASFIRSGDG